MKFLIHFFVILLATAHVPAAVWNVTADLQLAINAAEDGDTLIIEPGRYVAEPASFTESLCGNCPNHQTEVRASRGFVIDAKRLVLKGRKADDVVLVTRAGYGFLILNSDGATLENLTITGGKRDPDGRATDAAVVVKGSIATIRNCVLAENKDYIDSIVVGIGGVMVREGSEVRVERCRIIDNSWDGVALYRGAWALIRDCVIDSGRGAGIGVTWDAAATCVRNRISHYWKGIGSFGTATVVARNNAVFDNLGWGIVASGTSTMIAENNVVARNGNCGLAIWNRGTRGRLVNNLSAFNGWRKEWVCPCVGFWNQEADTAGWEVSHNLVWGNRAGNVIGADSTGFLIADPMFADTATFRLQPPSPAVNAGDDALTDPDGSRSDVGLYGGPQARPRY